MLPGVVNTIIKKTLYVEPGIPPHRPPKPHTLNSNSHGFNNWKITWGKT